MADTSRFDSKLKRIREQVPKAARQMAMDIGHAAAVAMFDASWRDTNRFARAWAEANNSAGLPPMPLPPIVRSRYQEQYRDRLVRQLVQVRASMAKVARWIDSTEKTIDARYTRKGRRGDQLYRALQQTLLRLTKRYLKLEKVEQRAIEQLKLLSDGAIVIGGRRKLDPSKDQGFSNLATVRAPRAVGGMGRVYQVGGQWLVEFRNSEPHARIVEYGGKTPSGRQVRPAKVKDAALRAVRSMNGKAMSAAAVKRLAG